MTTVPEQFVSNRPNSWTDIFQGLSSVVPRLFGPTVQPFPEIDSPAPALRDLTFDTPTLIAFVRHCGCPFAEKEVRLLAEQASENTQLRIVIVQHSPEQETKEWFERVRGHELFPDEGKKVVLISDPKRECYAAWGIGELGWGGMVNADIMRTLHKNKVQEGLDITKGDWSNYRWQNSGGFAVDGQGKVKWRKLAKDSSDVCDYAEAAASLGQGLA